MISDVQFMRAMGPRYVEPGVVLAIDHWADEHRRLPRGSAEPGPWRTERTPFVRQIMRDLSDDSPYHDVVIMCATQLVKSEIGLNWLGSVIDQSPAPFMCVQATVETGTRYSKQRIGPMIKLCPHLRDKVRDPRERDSGNTVLMKEFAGGPLIITGANSASGLASAPIKYLHLDERDDYPDDVDGQGDPTKIARARQDTFYRRKCLTSSSPKRPKGESRIEAEFDAGTRFYYHVPCPECGELQRLEPIDPMESLHPLVMTDDGRVVFCCIHCGAEIEEHLKTEMLREAGYGGKARWIAEDPDNDIRSYRLSSFYSPVGWLSWTTLLREYGEAKTALARGDDALMKTFANTRLADTYAEKVERVDSDDLRKRAEEFPLRVVPEKVLTLAAGVDVQDNRFEVCVYGFGPGEESWTVDYMQLFCDPSNDDAWTKLDDYLATRFPAQDGRVLPIAAAAIDTGGHFTHQVYQFCRTRKRMFAIKGAERPGLPVKGKSSAMDVNFRGKVFAKGVKLWFVGTDTAKDLLHNRMRMTIAGPGYIHFSSELPDEFFDGLTSEERRRIKTARGMRFTWTKRSSAARNEPLDCTVYALFAAHVLDLPRYTDDMWQRLRKRQERAAGARTVVRTEDQPQPALAQPVQPQPTPARKSSFIPRRGSFVNKW